MSIVLESDPGMPDESEKNEKLSASNKCDVTGEPPQPTGYKTLTVYQELANVPLVNTAVEKYCDLKNKFWLLKPGLSLMEYTYGGVLNVVSNFGIAKTVDKMVGSKMVQCKEKFPTLFHQSPSEISHTAQKTVKRRVRKLMSNRVGKRVITSLDWVVDKMDDMIEQAGGHVERRNVHPASPRRPVTRSVTRRAAQKAKMKGEKTLRQQAETGQDSEIHEPQTAGPTANNRQDPSQDIEVGRGDSATANRGDDADPINAVDDREDGERRDDRQDDDRRTGSRDERDGQGEGQIDFVDAVPMIEVMHSDDLDLGRRALGIRGHAISVDNTLDLDRVDTYRRNRAQQTIISSFKRSEKETQTTVRGLWYLASTAIVYPLEKLGCATMTFRRYIGGRRRKHRAHTYPGQQIDIDARRKLSPKKICESSTKMGRILTFARSVVRYLPFHGLFIPVSKKIMPTSPCTSPEASPRKARKSSRSKIEDTSKSESSTSEIGAGQQAEGSTKAQPADIQRSGIDSSKLQATSAEPQADQPGPVTDPTHAEPGSQHDPADHVIREHVPGTNIKVIPNAMPEMAPGSPKAQEAAQAECTNHERKRRHTDTYSDEGSDTELADLDENYDSYESDEDPDYEPEETDSDLSIEDSDDAETESDLEPEQAGQLEDTGPSKVTILNVQKLSVEEIARYKRGARKRDTEGENGEKAEDGGHDSPDKTPEKGTKTTKQSPQIRAGLTHETMVDVHAEQTMGSPQQDMTSPNIEKYEEEMAWREIPTPERSKEASSAAHFAALQEMSKELGHSYFPDESVDTCEEAMVDPGVSGMQQH